MDKNTKKLIVVIIVMVISIVCAAIGVSLGVPLETLVPIGTELIDELADPSPDLTACYATVTPQNPSIFATI